MMSVLRILLAGLLLSAGSATVMAQTAPARSPVSGDPVAQVAKPKASNASRAARADKQPPGTENGNQPDRAAAGGGSH